MYDGRGLLFILIKLPAYTWKSFFFSTCIGRAPNSCNDIRPSTDSTMPPAKPSTFFNERLMAARHKE